MNNTSNTCPAIRVNNGIVTTDWRPSKALYVNVYNSNQFRKYLQENGNKIRGQNLQSFKQQMGCYSCEGQASGVKPFANKM